MGNVVGARLLAQFWASALKTIILAVFLASSIFSFACEQFFCIPLKYDYTTCTVSSPEAKDKRISILGTETKLSFVTKQKMTADGFKHYSPV